MIRERPVEILPARGRHRTETRIFARRIHESYCVQPGCRFKGQHARQGICFSRKGRDFDWDRLAAVEKRAYTELRTARKTEQGPHYVKYLEAYNVCYLMNWQFTLDECIRLRRDNAILKDRLARRRRK